MERASDAAVARYGTTDALKQYAAPDRRWWSTTWCEPAQKPPTEQKALLSAAVVTSISVRYR